MSIRVLHPEGEKITWKALALLRELPLAVGAFILADIAGGSHVH